MKNALTIDLEEYYQATAFSAGRDPSASQSFISRVEQSTEKLLELLAERRCLATFFVVGSVAEKFPRLIERVFLAGHELGCHSYAHRHVFSMTKDQFHRDTLRAKRAIEDAVGTSVQGYRAPSFSITQDTDWAFEVLAELGFTYDSSIFPIKHLHFDRRNVSRGPFLIKTSAGSILEFPLTTLQVAGARAPIAGGAYFRLLPYFYTRWGIRYLNAAENLPACVYLHPWELDPQQPRMQGSITARMRHYSGLQRAESRFRRLLDDFSFEPLGVFAEELINRLSVGMTADSSHIRLNSLSGVTRVS
jgi:polysaccharide deacetylase family protein (PEP-CTERM system associated)